MIGNMDPRVHVCKFKQSLLFTNIFWNKFRQSLSGIFNITNSTSIYVLEQNLETFLYVLYL